MKRYLEKDKLELINDDKQMTIKDIKDAFRGLKLIGLDDIKIIAYSSHININMQRFYMFFKSDQEAMLSMFSQGQEVEIKENRMVFYYKDRKVNFYDENIDIDSVTFTFRENGTEG